jgi:hypothetical protein
MPEILAPGKKSSQLDGCYGRFLGMLFVWLLAKLGLIDQKHAQVRSGFWRFILNLVLTMVVLTVAACIWIEYR